MLRQIPTDTVAHALACRPAELRELRAAFLLEGVGERVGKVTMYARGEVGLIAVAFFLRGCGLKTGAAFAIAREHAHQIRDAAGPTAAADPMLLVRIDSRFAAGYVASIAPSDDAGAGTAGTAQAILGINLKRVVDVALTRLPSARAA